MLARLLSLASLLLIVVASSFAFAVPITVPTDLGPGEQYRLVFVTSTSRDATSSQISDYNDFVTLVAQSDPTLLQLGTEWRAIASTLSANVSETPRPFAITVGRWKVTNDGRREGSHDIERVSGPRRGG